MGAGALALLCLCGQAKAQSIGKHEEAAAFGAAPIYREFGDWVLVCDNVRTCVARYANEQADGNDGYLNLSRDAGPAGAVSVTVSYPVGGRLDLDGRSLDRYPWASVRRRKESPQAIIKGAAALNFVHAVRDGRKLAYNSDGSVVSLDGFKAALSAMDEAQGRAGSQTALVEIGDKPASSVPPAPPLPVVHAAPNKADLANPKRFTEAVRSAWQDELKKRDCDLDLAADDHVFAPDAGHVVVFLACNVGAYNTQGLMFIAPRTALDQARLLVLPAEPGKPSAGVSAQDAGVYFWNSYAPDTGWKPKTATFLTRSKIRGRGDCGERSGWTFDGKAFQPTHYAKLDSCGGGPEGDWPTLFRARVVVK
jgi:hypothetical protein